MYARTMADDPKADKGELLAAAHVSRPVGAHAIARAVGVPFLVSRMAVWFVLVFAALSVPTAFRIPPPEDVPAYTRDLGWVTDLWARWDSVAYLAVAEHGYDDPLNKASAAFYPLYSLLVGIVGRALFGHYVLAALLVSLAASVAAACLLYELARMHLGHSVALRAIVFLGVFPYVLFLQAIYSEALFLSLALAAFVAAERQKMTLAAVLAGCCLLTRPTGIAVFAALLVFAWRGRDRVAGLLRLMIAPAMFTLYPLLLWHQLREPLGFLHAQRLWGRSVSPEGPLAGLWQGGRAAWFGARQLISGTFEHPLGTSIDPDRIALMNLEIFFYVIVFTVLSVIAWRRLSAPYGLYAFGCLALALSAPSSTYPYPLLSFPRFAVVIFPAFIALAVVARRPSLVAGIVGMSTLLLGVNLVRWAAWQFIG
jgi:hypothetical protein